MTPQELKASILQLAIQGKLVPQIESEGNAEDLYREIQKEKQKLIAEKKIKKEKPLEPIKGEEIPFDIPSSWKWCRLGELGEYRKGPFGSSLTKAMFVPKSETSVKVYEQKNAIKKDYSIGEYYISQQKYEEMKGFEVLPHDIIVSCAGTIGETYFIPNDAPIGIINQALMRVRLVSNDIVPFWLLYFDYILKAQAKINSSGTAIKNIPPFEVLKAYCFPLPPLEEQKRIVAKIEELLPLVERYGKAYERLEDFNKRFPDEMKKSVLQMAIQGKLVEQRPEEGTAEELYELIKTEKAKLIKEGKIKKEKPLEPIKEEEIPFDIPSSWKWVKLDDVVRKTIKRGKSPTYSNDGKALVFAQKCNVKKGGIDLSLALKLDDKVFPKYPTEEYMENEDVVINSTGGGTMGRVGFYHSSDNPSNVIVVPDSHITIIRSSNSVSAPYVYYFLKSSQRYLETLGDGSTNQTELKADTLKNLLFPLPPLEEQKRIVAKLEEVLPLCDALIK